MAATPGSQVSVGENQQPKIQIYSPSNDEVSAFWREKYEKDAKKNWDIFYKRHQDKFFKDRHYLDKEWGHHFSREGRTVILEVGCGVGNTVFPLLATYPDLFVHACDFSLRAVNLVKTHKDFTEAKVNAFVCDLTVDDLCAHVAPSSVDIVTMIFVLSAVSPEKMPLAIQNIRKVLKPNGRILFRDYATGDLAQERFTGKEQKISENFYVRGDGTRAFYFSDEFLENLFKGNGLSMEEHVLCCKQVENRSKELVMNRRWVQAVFRAAESGNAPVQLQGGHDESKDDIEATEVDISEGIALEMFGISSPSEEIVELSIRDFAFRIKLLSKEFQHTCKSTGLMLWESARLMASVLATNQDIVAGKRVLELGSGCVGICSMIAAASAELVVATDGDTKALDLLTENVASNLRSPSLDLLHVKKLEWGNADDIRAIKQMNEEGFDVIIGTDVTYVAEAIIPLFATARELISTNRFAENKKEPALILSHVLRRVDEPSILAAASQCGFRLADGWSDDTPNSSLRGIIETWFSTSPYDVPSAALKIMYFHIA
ncbi:S-adenosyl-L-methionine-dependent methyltransferases superfamily protein [Perilla frutescens var. hirtella]|nr:S-adenosyl-L-methionine-dependent methyltransferases superfamily protein [Perilla frutescens var. hirtella]